MQVKMGAYLSSGGMHHMTETLFLNWIQIILGQHFGTSKREKNEIFSFYKLRLHKLPKIHLCIDALFGFSMPTSVEDYFRNSADDLRQNFEWILMCFRVFQRNQKLTVVDKEDKDNTQ